ncbi:TonB family protein [Labilibacter sediminis]|nr:TonB family protein [Labilibacter sediminis]
MENIVSYLIESSLILGVLTLFYKVVLHLEPFFKFNRFYLLVSLLLATVIPLIHISLEQSVSADNTGFSVLLDSVNVYAGEVHQVVVPIIMDNSLFRWLYLLGTIVLFTRLVTGIIRLGGLSRKAVWQSHSGFKIADLPGRFNPFSFFHIIFINRSLYSNNDLNKILVHEKAHIRFKHSVDVLIIELLLIVQWFNPFAWLIRHLLKELHEFQADRKVLSDGTSVGEYKELLLFQATGARLLPVNNFNQSITKKRFKMMTNNKLKNNSVFKIITALALIVGVGLFFACDNEDPNEITDQNLKGAEIEEAAYKVVEVMPQYPGGEKELRKFIAQNVKYPVEAQKLGVQGRVYVKFVVNDLGKVTNVKVVRGVHETLDAEAIRVISSMPKWTPGMHKGEYVDVEYTIPINFTLEGKNVKETFNPSNLKDALIFVDGKEISKEKMSKISPDLIHSVSVFKKEAAIKQYGDRGKNGVVQISLKSDAETSKSQSKEMEGVHVVGYK